MVRCDPYYFQVDQRNTVIPTMGEFLSRIPASELASWEVAFRAYLTDPISLSRYNNQILLHLDDSMKHQGHVMCSFVKGGGDGPIITRGK